MERVAMRQFRWIGIGLAFVAGSLAATAVAHISRRAEVPLAHMVFFQLKDRSAESRQKFAESTRKHLGGIEGVTYFSVGTLAEDPDVQEPVSVKDFDVALHVVFPSKAAKAAYLKNPHHDAFVAENKDQFAQVQVFDSFLITDK
jgi:hypothetical protein